MSKCWYCRRGFYEETGICVIHDADRHGTGLNIVRNCCTAKCAHAAIAWTPESRKRDQVHDQDMGYA